MSGLGRAFGWPLAAALVLLTALWVAGLIVMPLATMVDRAFTYVDRGGALPQLRTDIRRAYAERTQVDYDLRQLRAGGSVAAPPASRAAPRISIPSLGAPRPGGQPGASEPGESDEGRIAALEQRRDALSQRIAELEAEEERLVAAAANAPRYSLRNFTSMSPLHASIFVKTLGYALAVSVLSFVVCYPVAFALAMSGSANRTALLIALLVVPYAINELLRIFAWVMILEREGVLNAALSGIGVFGAGEGPRWVASNGAVFVVMIYAYILFMVFPLYNTLDTLDKNQIEAARDLGASTLMVHRRVVLPHARPGIAVGAILTFMLSAGAIAPPEIVGRGLHPDWFSQVIYRRFFESPAWNEGAAYALALLVACLAFVLAVMAIFRVSLREIAR